MIGLALAKCGDYLDRVKFFRSLSIVLIGCALFVQVAAQAAAIPRNELADMDCAEAMQDGDYDAGTQLMNCCHDMKLDCLVIMNCLAPMALNSAFISVDTTPAPVSNYDPVYTVWLKDHLARPDSPPPQAYVTA